MKNPSASKSGWMKSRRRLIIPGCAWPASTCQRAAGTAKRNEGDPETAKQAIEDIQEAKKLLARTRSEHLKAIRQIELGKIKQFFHAEVREHARPAEVSSFENLTKTAQRSIDSNSGDFESLLNDLRGKIYAILWRQDWFIVNRFRWLSENTFLFPNSTEHSQLCGTRQTSSSSWRHERAPGGGSSPQLDPRRNCR